MKITKKVTSLISFLILITLKITYSQQSTISEFEYISPVPSSGMNMPETNIIIWYGPAFSSNDIYSQKNKKLRVVGNIPYNITSPILFKLIEYNDVIEDYTF